MKLAIEEECKGFLLTCQQNREKQAIKDAYNFLGEFIDKLYPQLHGDKQTESLQDQIKQMQSKRSRVLFNLDTNVKCCIFIKINPQYNIIDPCRVVEQIMEDMKIQQRQLTRYCHRVTPVEKAFKAEFFRMRDAVEQLLSSKTKGQKKSWALNFKCRNNDKFKYKEVLQAVTEIANGFGHFADIYYPEWTISIQINHHLMCISILEKFKESNEFKLRKINVQPLPPLKNTHQPQQSEEVPKPSKAQITTEAIKVQSLEHSVDKVNIQEEARQAARKLLLAERIKPKEDDAELF